MQKSSTKHEQAEFNHILKEPYTMIKLDLSQACKDGSTPTNQEQKLYNDLNTCRQLLTKININL